MGIEFGDTLLMTECKVITCLFFWCLLDTRKNKGLIYHLCDANILLPQLFNEMFNSQLTYCKFKTIKQKKNRQT